MVEFLPTEQPQVSNCRADLLGRTADGLLRQVEFQANSELDFPLRLLEYYVRGVRTYGEHLRLVVLYVGREPMRLENRYASPSKDFRFEIVNVRELDAGPLLSSDDIADNILALLPRVRPKRPWIS